MAKIETFFGKKLKRVPKNVEIISTLSLDIGTVLVYHANFQTPDGIIGGLSVDKENWIQAVKEDGKLLLGPLLPYLTKKDIVRVKHADFLY